MKLLQKEMAGILGVDTTTVTNWEKGRTTPRLHYLPKVVEFLGYSPFESNAPSLGEQIKAYRVREGLSLRRMAKILGVDPDTVAQWEKNRSQPSTTAKARLDEMLNWREPHQT